MTQKISLWKIVLIVSIFLSLLLSFRIISGNLLFTYDQARDAFESYTIWHDKNIKILGPASDIPGVFHGALWYYVLAIPYAQGGNPEIAAWFIFFLSFLSVPLCGMLSYKLFSDRIIAIISMALYLSSPLFFAISHWLSNPAMTLLFIPILLLSAWQFIKKQSNIYALLIGASFGLLIQSNFSFGLLTTSLILYFLIFRPKISVLNIIILLLGFLISIATYILAEIKFHFRATQSIIHFLQNSSGASSNLLEFTKQVWERWLDFFTITILPFPSIIVIAILAIIIYKFRKSLNKQVLFLLIWIGQFFLFQLFNSGIVRSAFVFAPFLLPLAILFSFILKTQIKNRKLLLAVVVLLIVSQNLKSNEWLKNEFNPLAVQQGMFWKYEKDLVDYTYKSSQGMPFTILTVTNPLLINTTWAYAYEFYGKEKYGFLPFWGGNDQKGLLGNLPQASSATVDRYLILEPPSGIPEVYFKKAIEAENGYGKETEEKHFGKFSVQKRLLQTP